MRPSRRQTFASASRRWRSSRSVVRRPSLRSTSGRRSPSGPRWYVRRGRRPTDGMRIVAINEAAVPVRSAMRNAVFSFADMTTSVVAVVTDVIRGGKPVVGYAFNSTGRYACGAQMRARFIPRLLQAAPEALLDDAGTNLDPAKAVGAMLSGEKPGGHSERSIAIGTIEVALWDAVG